MKRHFRALLVSGTIGLTAAGCDTSADPLSPDSMPQRTVALQGASEQGLTTSGGGRSPHIRNLTITGIGYDENTGATRVSRADSRRIRLETTGLEGAVCYQDGDDIILRSTATCYYQDRIANEGYAPMMQRIRLDFTMEPTGDSFTRTTGVRISGESVMSITGFGSFETKRLRWRARASGVGTCQPDRDHPCSAILIHRLDLSGQVIDEGSQRQVGTMSVQYQSVYLDVWEQSVSAWLHGAGTVWGTSALRVMPGDNIQ